jgi:hypothetical protein
VLSKEYGFRPGFFSCFHLQERDVTCLLSCRRPCDEAEEDEKAQSVAKAGKAPCSLDIPSVVQVIYVGRILHKQENGGRVFEALGDYRPGRECAGGDLAPRRIYQPLLPQRS